MKPTLTIGMAHHQDFDGVYFTIQSLRLHHPRFMKQIEFVVVDNSPGTQHSQMTLDLLRNIEKEVAGVQYYPMTDPVGTSPSREKIFEIANGKYVLVLDCHVLLAPGALDSLFTYYEAHPECNDIISGPIMMDRMQDVDVEYGDEEEISWRPVVKTSSKSLAHIYGNVWRAEMWGIWETVWQCNCSRENGVKFVVENDEGICKFISPTMERTLVEGCPNCNESTPIPMPHYHEHELVLPDMGYHLVGSEPDDLPFEITGQGLGLFSCRKEAWLHFHPEARGFGGEELWIHEKFRRAGHKAICIPQLQWLHRFGRANGVHYPLTRWKKVRNYVLEFLQIGMSTDPIYTHFVESGMMPISEWMTLLSDPVGLVDGPQAKCNTCGQKPIPVPNPKYTSLQEIYDELKANERDLNLHMDRLCELATGLDHVTEIANRREPTVAFLKAAPKKFVSYNSERDSYTASALALIKNSDEWFEGSDEDNTQKIPEIEETDLLFIDSEHTYARLREELNKYYLSCRRYIVVHDTDIYGATGQDSNPGLLFALQEFCRLHPEWSVIEHTSLQYGLTILSKNPADKPVPPPLLSWKSVKKFAVAVGKHLADGASKVELPIYEQRLNTCALCPHRVDNRCSVCGCFVDEKAQMKTEDCPLALWPIAITPSSHPLELEEETSVVSADNSTEEKDQNNE